MGCTIMTSFCLRVTLSMRSPVAMSNGCAPVLASYSAITSFTSSMLAVAGSYSRSVVSPRDENVRILAFMVGLLLPFILSALGKQAAGLHPWRLYRTVSESCQDGIPGVIGSSCFAVLKFGSLEVAPQDRTNVRTANAGM